MRLYIEAMKKNDLYGDCDNLLMHLNNMQEQVKIITYKPVSETVKSDCTLTSKGYIQEAANFLIELGYTGFPLSKQHYNGDENCLTAYNKHFMPGHVILAQQFSNFFGFRVQL